MSNLAEQVTAQETDQNVYRTHKSRIFEMIFSDRKELLGLYNAMNGTSYDDPELLEINTLKNAIYLSMHNDISFLIDFRLCLYEHQSTNNPNLPLRYLMYVADLYSKITKDRNLYGSKRIELPTPKFVIFYNGTEELPDVQELRLSDAFTVREEAYSLELTATMLNINPGHNKELLSACKTLGDYSRYTEKVRTYAKDRPLNEAVEQAIEACIKDDVLAEFLRTNRTEAISVSIYEYDEEKVMRQLKEEYLETGIKKGHESGLAEGRKSGLAEGHESGLAEGLKGGRESGIQAFIESFSEEGFSEEQITEKLISKFSLTGEQAAKYYQSYASRVDAK